MSLFTFLKRLIGEFGQDKASQMSAAFAYVAIFSVGPLLLVLISVAGFLFGQQAIEGELFGALRDVVGADAARSIQEVIVETRQSNSGTLAFVVGSVGLLLAAAGLTGQLQGSFNTIFRVTSDPKAGIKVLIYGRLKNVVLVLIGGLIGIVSVVLSILVNGLGETVREYINISPGLLELCNTAVSLLIFVGVLYLLYRFLPDVRIPRNVVFCTATIVGLLFLVAKVILGLIIGHNGTASAYGAAASVIVLLLWFYYAAQILLLGAEGMKVYGLRHGVDYPVKRFTLKRKTLYVHIKGNVSGRVVDAFARGFHKRSQK